MYNVFPYFYVTAVEISRQKGATQEWRLARRQILSVKDRGRMKVSHNAEVLADGLTTKAAAQLALATLPPSPEMKMAKSGMARLER
ncbi:MAG: hypothetical protein WDO70_02415 [Alphaproteobacteria bacterium]